MNKIGFFLLGITFFLGACTRNHTVSTPAEYMKWLNEEKNGLVKIRYVNGIKMSVKLLPPDYLAQSDLASTPGYTRAQKDSILNIYKKSVSFMFTIGPDEREKKGGDIMLKSVVTYKEYATRVSEMNFKMEEYITLTSGKKTYKPVLSSMENVYEMDSGRNIILVFVPDQDGEEPLMHPDKLDFEYADELFDLGTNHFVFSGKDIENRPAYPFSNPN